MLADLNHYAEHLILLDMPYKENMSKTLQDSKSQVSYKKRHLSLFVVF